MQLRAHTRLPGRYREDDIPPLPGIAKFVHPTTPYNPNLPPAAFPTLDVPRPVALPPPETMDVEGSESSNSPLEVELPRRPAAVFRGKGRPPRISPSEVIQHVAEEEAESLEPELSLRRPQLSVSSEDPGDFEARGLNVNGERQDKNERVGLRAYELVDDWKHISNGLKLVILSEMMRNHSFKHVTEILILSDEEVEEIYNLHEREALRQAEEDARIVKAQARQLDALMRGAFATNRDRISALFADNVYANLKPPDMFVFGRKEIQQAQRFLNSLKLFEYGDRLWRYHGVAMVPNLVCMRTNGPSSIFWSSGSLGDRLHLQELQPGPSKNAHEPQLGTQTGSSRKRKQQSPSGKLLLSASRARKRPRTASRIVKAKVPASGLRNMVTAEDQEAAVTSTPAALQESLPTLPPAPLTPKLPETPKGSGSPQVRFKPLSNKLSPSTSPPRQVATSAAPALTPRGEQIARSPGSTTGNQVNTWRSSHNNLFSPLPPSISVPSIAQVTTSTPPNSQLSSTTETQSLPLKPSSVQMYPAEAQSTHLKQPSSPKEPKSQLSAAGPTTPSRPRKSLKSPKPQFSPTKTPKTTLSEAGEQQRSPCKAQLTPLNPRIVPSPPVETCMTLSESPQLKMPLSEAGLVFLESPLLHLTTDVAQLTLSESPHQQRSPFKAEMPPSKPQSPRIAPAMAVLKTSKPSQLQISPVQPQLAPSKHPKTQMSPAEKRFAMVAKRIGKTDVLSTLNGTAIEPSTPPKVPAIGALPEVLAKKTRSAQTNAKAVDAVLPAHSVSPASPDPLTGEAQTREPAKKHKPAFLMKTLGKAIFENLETSTEEPVTPTKKPKRVETTQKRNKSFAKSMFKPVNGIAKEGVTTKAAPLKAREKAAKVASTNEIAKTRDKEGKGSKAAAAKLKGIELVRDTSQTKNMTDRALPQENGLPNRKRKQLHDSDDDQDI